MKAIETEYAEHLFRSRLEARYAVFLDTVGEKWVYEPDTYDLDGEWYLPDFWLPRMNCFLEIKGPQPTESEIRKCRKLQYHSGKAVLIAYGLPNQNEMIWFAWDSGDSGGGMDEYPVKWGLDENRQLTLVLRDYNPNRTYFSEEWKVAFVPSDDWADMALVQPAITKAKQARFEFGQTPSRTYPNIVDYDDIKF